MKNKLRFGIALLALIVFSMTACDDGTDSGEVEEEKHDVISVTVLPGSDRVHRGYQLSFVAVVTGTGSKTVTWSIEQKNKHPGTTIGNNGLLTVSPDEEQTALTVIAVLAADKTISDKATVSVPVPTITGVEISLHDNLALYPWNPSSKVMDIKSGTTEQFKARIVGANFPKQDVTWSIDGTQSGVSINPSSGLLTVSPDKPLNSTFIVRAASSIDAAKFDTITVTVRTPVINRVTIVPSSPSLGTSYTYMDEIAFTPTYTGSGRITVSEFPAPADLSWEVGRADGQLIEDEERELEIWDEENQITTTETIPPTHFDDNVLKVSFFEKEGNLWAALTVTFADRVPPTITSSPVTISFMNILAPN